MMRMTVVFSLLMIFFLTGCTQKEIVLPQSEKEVSIRFSQTVSLSQQGISIQFSELVDDSRCPAGVACIWEGEVTVKLQIRISDREPEIAILGLSPRPEVAQSYEAGGHTFTLKEVNPYPVHGKTTRLKDYSVVVEIQ
ncbi:MAG: hypothetical protein R3C61_21745 [Bacteroidia bacterium]